MEKLRMIVSGLFKVVLLVCVFFLLISFSASGILKDGLSSVVGSKMFLIPGFEEVSVNNDKVMEFIQEPETKEFIMEYIDPIIGGEVDVDDINLGEDIYSFVLNNRDKIEEIVGEPIDMEQLKEFTDSEEMQAINEQYIDVVVNTKEIVPTEVKTMVHTYSFFLTGKFRLLMGIISGTAILLIALLEKSYHSWMKTVGKTLIGCGFVIVLFTLVGSSILNSILEAFDFFVFNLEYKNALRVAIISIIIGVVLAVIYSRVERHIKERSILNDISKSTAT